MMKMKQTIKNAVRELFQVPFNRLNRWQKAARFASEVTVHCAKSLKHDKATQMAAALTYHTLFSLLPTVALVLVILNTTLVREEDRAQFKEDAINWVLQPIGDGSAGPGDANAFASTDADLQFAQVRATFAEKLQEWMGKLEGLNFGSIGIVGVLVFIYAATGLLGTIERSFNSIFGISRGRAAYVRLPLYYTVITLAPLLLILGRTAQGWFFEMLSAGAWTNWLVGPAVVMAPVMSTWIVFYLMFVLMPVTSVGVRPAAIGSFVAAVGWVILIELFGLYVSNAAVTTLYGALALLPLFLLWLYCGWLVILFGLEITYTLHAMKGHEFHHDKLKQHDDELIDPATLVPMMVMVGEAFNRGKTCTVTKISDHIGVRARTVRKLLGAFEAQGLINQVDGEDEGFALARPAEAIQVDAILRIGESLTATEHAEAVGPAEARAFVERMYRSRHEIAADTTLADLIGDDGAPPRESADSPKRNDAAGRDAEAGVDEPITSQA